MSKPVSLIIPVRNQLEQTILCLKHLYTNSNKELIETIIVDNGSKDGTRQYLSAFKENELSLKVIMNQTNLGFAKAINQGLAIAKGQYLCFLNNDAYVGPNWLMQLLDCLNNAHQINGLTKIGLVGPTSNLVAGKQQIAPPFPTVEQLENFSKQYYLQNHQKWVYVGFLSFFCVLMKREVFEDVGYLDERYYPGGFEDTSYVLDAQAKGWKSVIAGDTFVYHAGHKTFDAEFPSAKRGLANRTKFYNKYDRTGKKQKVVAMYRVKNAEKYFQESLDSVARLVDEIVVLDDGSIDRTYEIAKNHPKVVSLETQNLELNEARDREKLLYMAKERCPDWILVIDGDEVLSDGWTEENFKKLIYPVNPMAKAYIFRYANFWNFTSYTRGDNVWRGMMNTRLFLNEPEQHIRSDHPVGFHCNSTPPIPGENIFFAPTSMRIKHYGYLDPIERQRKYEWYEKNDTAKNPRAIGAKNYSHLVNEAGLRLREWIPQNTLALNMIVKNEGAILESFFEYIYNLFDEIIVVDTGSTDNSKEIALRYGAKVFDFSWCDDFSKARNFAKEQTTSRWILHLDADESIPTNTIQNLPILCEETGIHGYLFMMANRQLDGGSSLSESVRLFRNIPEIYYSGYVHETFDSCRGEIPDWTCPRTNLIIYHNGFLRGNDFVEEKLQAYHRMNSKQMEDFPDDPRPVYNIAMHYINNGNMQEGVSLLKKAKELDSGFYLPRQQLGCFHLNEARKQYNEVLEILPKEHPFFADIKESIEFIDSKIGGYPWRVGRAAEKNC